jgi:pimeloyl-ACP methyl ester carboxylesterase
LRFSIRATHSIVVAMPAVLVHGVPETPAVWDPLRSFLRRPDVLSLRLPGFGQRAPSGFGATKDDYVDWLVGELENVDEPVDLVGLEDFWALPAELRSGDGG